METTEKDFIDPLSSSNGEEVAPSKSEDEVDSFTDWENEPTVEDLKNDLIAVQNDHDTHVSKVEQWLDNLNVTGKAKPNKRPGRSEHQPRLIRKQAEWRYAALSEPFLANDNLFTARPVTAEDKTSAEQNQLILNTQFRKYIDRTRFIDSYVRCAVNEGTAILRTGWEFVEEEQEVEVPEYGPAETPDDFAALEELAIMVQASPQEFAKVPTEWQTALAITMEEGNPTIFKGYITKTRMVTVKNCPTVEVCDYNDVMIDPTCEGDIDKANFVIYRFETSLAQLKKEGVYQNLDYIETGSESILSQPDSSVDEERDSGFKFNDKPRQKFYAYEYWGFWDANNNGILVPIVATFVGNTLIRLEENPFPDKKLPFVVVPYLPVKKSVYGEPDGVLIEDNQRIVGAVTRGMIDSMARSANGQIGLRKDLLDPINRRKYDMGQDYEFNPGVDPRQGIINHTYPELPQSAYAMIQTQNAEAESLTGVKAYSGGISGEALGEVAAGVRGALDAASKRELGILRRLADGIVKVGRKFIAMNAEFLEEEEVVRITNDEFVTIRRDDLNGAIDLQLDITTAEEDNQKAQELAFMLQTTGQHMGTAFSQIILAEIAKLRKMPDLAKRIEEFVPQPDPVQQAIQQLEIQKLQAEIAKLQSEAFENNAEAELDLAKARDTQSSADLKNLDFLEQESGTKHARDVDKITAQARSQTQKSIVEKAIDNRIEQSKGRESEQ